MKVFIYDGYSELGDFFGTTTGGVPFLSSTLLEFSESAIRSQAERLGEELEIFRTPDSYLAHLGEEHELVVVVDPGTVLVGEISRDDLHFLQQRPGKLFYTGNVYCGFIDRGFNVAPEKNDTLLPGFLSLTMANFLRTNQSLVGRLGQSARQELPSNDVYGAPVVLTDRVTNSTICGPSFIGEDVTIHNSYIGPGTVLTGSSGVVNSRIYSSFVYNSSLSALTHGENLLTADARVSGISFLEDSLLPVGTRLSGPSGE